MRIKSAFRLIVVFMLSIVSTSNFYAVETAEFSSLFQSETLDPSFVIMNIGSFIKAREIIEGAEANIDSIILQGLGLIESPMNFCDAAQAIKEQNLMITKARWNLKQLSKQSQGRVKFCGDQDGHSNKLSLNIQKIGINVLTQLRTWCGYISEEQEIMNLIIAGLKEQQAKIAYVYKSTLREKDLNSDERTALKGRYKVLMAQLNSEICRQQFIDGNYRKLFWGFTGFMGTLMCTFLGVRYLKVPVLAAEEDKPQNAKNAKKMVTVLNNDQNVVKKSHNKQIELDNKIKNDKDVKRKKIKNEYESRVEAAQLAPKKVKVINQEIKKPENESITTKMMKVMQPVIQEANKLGKKFVEVFSENEISEQFID